MEIQQSVFHKFNMNGNLLAIYVKEMAFDNKMWHDSMCTPKHVSRSLTIALVMAGR